MKVWWLLIISLLCPLSGLAKTDIPAFPGASGDGALALGGRGGKVLWVDRLDDPCLGDCQTVDMNNPKLTVPGTLRWALLEPYPRTVIFRVSGNIDLQPFKIKNTSRGYDYTGDTSIRIASPYLTVAGQTAPGGGITIRNAGISVETHDVVIRYIRLRTGRDESVMIPNQQGPETLMVGEGAYNIMIDHCSVSWMPAESVSVYGMGHRPLSNATFSWNIMGEALIQKGDLGHPGSSFMAGFEGDEAPEKVTLHHNLLVHGQKRNGDVLIKSASLINNLIYNWQWTGTIVGGGIDLDMVGNIWKPGPQTSNDPMSRRPIHLVPAAQDRPNYEPGRQDWWIATRGKPFIYLADNIFKGKSDKVLTDWQMVCYYTSNKDQLCRDKEIKTAWQSDKIVNKQTFPVKAEPAQEAENHVLALAGASRHLNDLGEWVDNRDSVDQRYVQEYHDETYINPTFPWHEKQVGGYPSLAAGLAYTDADKDGMADEWEVKMGLKPTDSVDGLLDNNGDGYTNLEAFLNGITP